MNNDLKSVFSQALPIAVEYYADVCGNEKEVKRLVELPMHKDLSEWTAEQIQTANLALKYFHKFVKNDNKHLAPSYISNHEVFVITDEPLILYAIQKTESLSVSAFIRKKANSLNANDLKQFLNAKRGKKSPTFINDWREEYHKKYAVIEDNTWSTKLTDVRNEMRNEKK